MPENSVATHLRSRPAPFVGVTILESELPVFARLAKGPESFVAGTVGPGHGSLAVAHPVEPGSFVNSA